MTVSALDSEINREEFKLHVRPALGSGIILAEMRAFLKQTAVYAGVPAANGAVRRLRDVLGDDLEG